METSCRDLLACVGDPIALSSACAAFKAELLEHLAIEDELLVPEFLEHDPDGAARIRADHVAIRKLLDRLSASDLVATETVNSLVHAIHEHSFREESTMYPWADSHLSVEKRRAICARIAATLQLLPDHRSEDHPSHRR